MTEEFRLGYREEAAKQAANYRDNNRTDVSVF